VKNNRIIHKQDYYSSRNKITTRLLSKPSTRAIKI